MGDLELVATAVAAGGDAIARDPDGRVVFVAGALPGERVRASIVRSKRDYAKAVAVEVIEPSPDRVAASHLCGACTWQHVAPDAQRRWKEAVVVDALRRIAHREDVPVTTRGPLVDGPPAGRTTARLVVDHDGRLGYRAPGSHDVVVDPGGPCPNLHPLLRDLVVSSAGHWPPGAEVVLRVAVATGEHLTMVVGGRPSAAAVHEDVAGHRFRVSARSFFQSGPAAAAALVEAVTAAAAPRDGGLLVDLYAGVGLFAAALGPRFDAVVAVEENPSAVRDARRNLASLAATVVEGEVGQWRPPAASPAPALLVADPARTGLGRPGVGTIAALAPPRLVLVSCDPASLARDTVLLAEAGYRPDRVELVDAFPDTFHLEAVTGFEPAGLAGHPQGNVHHA
jgi:tRNA/tmRNA/rRNA uracil-C5-methylase (TrmA/RlmC/RlmD family)